MEQKQFYIVLAVIVNDKSEILLARRNEPGVEYAHNKWELVGGGIEFGEDPLEALRREVREEAGVEIEVIRLLPKIVSHVWELKNKRHQIIMICYQCRIASGQLRPGLDQEIGELKFVPLEEIPNYDTLPNVYETAKMTLTKN